MPFFAFIIAILPFVSKRPAFSGIIAITGIFISTVFSYILAYNYFFVSGKVNGIYEPVLAFDYTWMRFSESLQINMGALLDPVSVMMLIVITTVSLMVFVYSFEYMKGERGFARYFAFLSLFSFSMLGLVLATNIFQMYIFWELVGLSSFLLISYYYEKPSAVAAAKKAFIVTRFADLGFLIGILFLSYYTGTFDFVTLTSLEGPAMTMIPAVSFLGLSLITWILLMIFMGGAGKSALFPLHIWLPDAMEGPSPVSALIHAATMVVAGVYLVARMFPVFYFTSPEALMAVAYAGGFTALFAAVIACTQTDFKRILAFSTLSQIGFMILALGVSGYGGAAGLGYTASMFHLFTHAMFKALLFLAAGSVIHAVHTNDIFKMGNLRKFLPVTHITFLIACLAISGIPPFAGFFSKDEILVAAFVGDKLLFAIAFCVSGITAFYMFRLYFTVFWGKAQEYAELPHESPVLMTTPLIILAIASIFAGFIPFSTLVTSDGIPFEASLNWNIAIPAISIALLGIFTAMLMYAKETNYSNKVASALGGFYQTVYRKFYIDEIYLFVTHKIIFNCVSQPIAWFDRHIIDNVMNGVAYTSNGVSEKIKFVQSGQVQMYALMFLTGTLLLILFLLT